MALACKKDGIMVLCSWKKKAGGPMPENAKDMFYPVLANRVQYFKQDAKGVATMCRAMEEMRKDERIECALEMLADGMPYEKVAKYSKLTLEEVKALDTKKSA